MTPEQKLINKIEQIINTAVDEKPDDMWDKGWRAFAVMLKTHIKQYHKEQEKDTK